MAAFSTVIFDMDGTLVDTMRLTAPAFSFLSEEFGLAPLPEARVRGAIGLADMDFYRSLYPDADAETLRAFSRAVEAEENARARALGPGLLFPGVAEMLHELRDAGRTLYIASTGSESHVTTALTEAGILGLFQGIACGRADKAGMVAELIRGLDPGVCAIVGDTALDASAGHQNGTLALGAGFGYLKPEHHALFDQVYPTPGALLKALTGGTTRAKEKKG